MKTIAPPLVSVIMSVYNGEKHINQAINSILQQTFSCFEFLIIDDGSNDNSKEIISSYQDTRIRFIENSHNIGLAASLNRGVTCARGKYIARMDSDDVAYPERLIKQYMALESDNTLDLISANVLEIDEIGNIIRKQVSSLNHEDICSKPWRGFYMAHPTWMGKATWFRENPYRDPPAYFCEDQELLFCSYKYSKFGSLPDVLLAYRIRDNINQKKLFMTRYAVLKLQLRNFNIYREFSYVLLSLFIFVARVLNDGLKSILRFFQLENMSVVNDKTNTLYGTNWLKVQINTSKLRGTLQNEKKPDQ